VLVWALIYAPLSSTASGTMIEILHDSWELMAVLQRRVVVGTAPVRSRETVDAVVKFGKMGAASTRPDGHGSQT
jgi:hypothetical protein